MSKLGGSNEKIASKQDVGATGLSSTGSEGQLIPRVYGRLFQTSPSFEISSILKLFWKCDQR